MRAHAFAVVGGVASASLAAHAEPLADASAQPRWTASGFVGVDWFGEHSELGNSWAPDQVPGTSALVGARASWLAAPALPGALELAVEAELAVSPAFTAEHADAHGARRSYFAPVFAWRGHALLRLARWPVLRPHIVLGVGGATVASSSPFMSKETDPVAYWGPGLGVPLSGGWHLRLDLRHGVMPARGGGATSTLELELGLGTTFGRAARPARPRVAAAAVPPGADPTTDSDGDGVPDRLDGCPAAPESQNGVADDDGCPEPDPDGDGKLAGADRCPDQPEDLDGFEDDDGCPEPDNDRDGIEDRHDTCPLEAESANAFEDEDGCPDALPADVSAALATQVRFEPGRARVTRSAAAALHPVLAMLRRHRGLHLSITGHPDRAGGDDLARRRAEAVKWHLVDQGIARDRIATTVAAGRSPAITLQLATAPP